MKNIRFRLFYIGNGPYICRPDRPRADDLNQPFK